MGKTSKPLISVVMSVFNSESYVKEAIDSILNQTLGDFEFIILDDGSTDGSVDIIQKYTDSRIHFIRNERNLGLRDSLNRGIRLAEGKYIARMDSDDIASAKRFEIQAGYMEQHPDVVMCGGNINYLIDGKLKKNKEIFPLSFQEIRIALIRYNCFFHPTVMLRTDFVREHELYYQRTFADDYDLWIRIMNQAVLSGKLMINLPEIFLYYRIHSANFGKRKREIAREVADIQKEYMDFFELKEQEKNLLLEGFLGNINSISDIKNISKVLIKCGDYIDDKWAEDKGFVKILSKYFYELCYVNAKIGLSAFILFLKINQINHTKLEDYIKLFIKCVFKGDTHRF